MKFRKINFLWACVMATTFVSAQTNKIVLKLGMGTANTQYVQDYKDPTGTAPYVFEKKVKPHVRISAGYQLFRDMDLGVYFGYSPFNQMVASDETNLQNISATGLFYGIHLNYQILSALCKKDMAFDAYIASKFGAYSCISNNALIADNTTNITFGIGVGLAYNITPHIGIFVEALYGKFANSKMDWQGGITYKL